MPSATAAPATAATIASEAQHIQAFVDSHPSKQRSRAVQELQLLKKISDELQRQFAPLLALDIPVGRSPAEQAAEQKALRAAHTQGEELLSFGIKSLANIPNTSALKDSILLKLKHVEDFVGLTYGRIIPGYESGPRIYDSGMLLVYNCRQLSIISV
jgi:hypothetical protein